MLDGIDPFALKNKFDWYNAVDDQFSALVQDARFMRSLARAWLLPRRLYRRPSTEVFPPLRVQPHPVLAGKRVGLVTSGGSGALVSLCGVKRALEEAAVEVCTVSVCSGSAIWGSMIAAGMSAQQMVDLSFSWHPTDMVDVDWGQIARLPISLGRRFSGISRGQAIDNTLRRAFHDMTLANAPIPYYAVVLNIDTNHVEYFGPHNHPDMPLATMVRIAVALPLFAQPVPVDGHDYVDGGVVHIFPVEPLLHHQPAVDFLIGVNVILPSGFRGVDISGWRQRPGTIQRLSRQLYHCQWLELARQQLRAAGDRMLLLEPVDYQQIVGSRFFGVFLDNAQWPAFVRQAYQHTKAKLAQWNPSSQGLPSGVTPCLP